MTLYYLFKNEHPRPNDGLGEDWFRKSWRAAQWEYDQDWLSAPNRLGRLIVGLTRIEQRQRLDFMTAVRKIELIAASALPPSSVTSAEFGAEECLAHVSSDKSYSWDDDCGAGLLNLPNGLSFAFKGDLASDLVFLIANYTDVGYVNRGSLPRSLNYALNESGKKLEDAGWTITAQPKATREAFLRAEISRSKCFEKMPESFSVCRDIHNLFINALS